MFFFDRPKNMNLDVEKLQKKIFQDRQRRREARLNRNNATEDDEESHSGSKSTFKGFAVGIIISVMAIIIGLIGFIKYKNEITNKIGYCFTQISLTTEKLLSDTLNNLNNLITIKNAGNVSSNTLDIINDEEQVPLENEEQAEISQSGIEDLVINRSYRPNVISDRDYGLKFYNWVEKRAKEMNAEGQYSAVIAWLKFHENDKGNKSSLFYNELGYAYSREGKHNLAIGNFKKALELNPAYAPSVNGLFNIYIELGRHSEIKILIDGYIAKGGLEENLSQEALQWINGSAHIKTYKLNT